MPKIIITKDAANALRAQARGQFRMDGKILPDGTVEIPIAPETLVLLDAKRLAGESYSDCIIRICATQRGAN